MTTTLTREQRTHLERRLEEERAQLTRALNRSVAEGAQGDEQDRDGDLSNLPFHLADRGTKEPLSSETMNAIARRCLEDGVLVLTAGTYGNVVRLLPPITIDDALLAEGLDVLDSALGGATG